MPIFGNLADARAAQLNGRREGEERQRSLLQQIEAARVAAEEREAQGRLRSAQIAKMERDAQSDEPLVEVDEGGRGILRPRGQAVGKPAYHAPVREPQEPVVPVVGDDESAVYVPRSQAAGRKVPQRAAGAGAEGRITDGERGVAGLLPEIEEGHAYLSAHGTPEALSVLAKRGGLLTNWAKSAEGRQYLQAADQFVANLIYVKTGKSATDEEKAQLRAIYIPMPGDDPGTVERKHHARALAIRGGRTTAGRAAQPAPAPSGADELERQAEEAIRHGADPAKVRARLAQLRAAAGTP